MTKLIVKLSLAAALCGGVFSGGACSSASTNTVSTGNTNAGGVTNAVNTAVAVNKPANAAVENANTVPANMKSANSMTDLRQPSRNEEISSSDTVKTEKIGVPECDEYIAKYEACVTGKVPEAQRAMYNSSMETMRKGWQNAATNPPAKAALAGGCKQALATAKQSMSAFSCGW